MSSQQAFDKMLKSLITKKMQIKTTLHHHISEDIYYHQKDNGKYDKPQMLVRIEKKEPYTLLVRL